MKATVKMLRSKSHGPEVVCYVGGPGIPYYKPHIQCICKWHTENGGPYNWEEAGAEFDEHLAAVETERRKRRAARKPPARKGGAR